MDNLYEQLNNMGYSFESIGLFTDPLGEDYVMIMEYCVILLGNCEAEFDRMVAEKAFDGERHFVVNNSTISIDKIISSIDVWSIETQGRNLFVNNGIILDPVPGLTLTTLKLFIGNETIAKYDHINDVTTSKKYLSEATKGNHLRHIAYHFHTHSLL